MFAHLGPTLILIRELRGKSQAAVAREAKIGKSQLSKYEHGKELPKLESLERVLAALSVGQLDFFSTLELVTRRAENLEQGSGRQSEALPAPRDFRTGLLSDETSEGFNLVMTNVLNLYGLVLSDVMARHCPKGGDDGAAKK